MVGNLQDTRIVVFGATGNVGSGVARAALEAGATVVLPARSARAEAELRAPLANGAPRESPDTFRIDGKIEDAPP